MLAHSHLLHLVSQVQVRQRKSQHEQVNNRGLHVVQHAQVYRLVLVGVNVLVVQVASRVIRVQVSAVRTNLVSGAFHFDHNSVAAAEHRA